MSRFEYTSPCPECSKLGLASTLGFETDTGKVTCNGEPAHEFNEMPGESAPIAEPETVPSTSDFAPEARGPESIWTPEEEAALDEAMKTDPRPRDFSAMLTDPAPEVTVAEIVAPEPAETQGEAISETSANSFGFGEHARAYREAVLGDDSPRVGLGDVVMLPNGDAICGVRVSELWVSAMVAEGENRTPALNLAEYLQEIMDTSLLDWHSSIPGAR